LTLFPWDAGGDALGGALLGMTRTLVLGGLGGGGHLGAVARRVLVSVLVISGWLAARGVRSDHSLSRSISILLRHWLTKSNDGHRDASQP
jgi:hypothetical protein